MEDRINGFGSLTRPSVIARRGSSLRNTGSRGGGRRRSAHWPHGTVYCTEPPVGVATRTRVGGPKNPKLDVIRELGADLVVANVEENVREHVETLRGWGIPVYVTYPRTVVEGIRLVSDLGAGVGLPERGGEGAAAPEAARAGGG